MKINYIKMKIVMTTTKVIIATIIITITTKITKVIYSKPLSSKRSSPVKMQTLKILVIKLLDTFFNMKPK